MTVTSKGINYDRLALLYFGDMEVWRFTTAMPVRTGIYYHFSKDMTAYMPLLRQEQKVILQLDNIYDSVFTGDFNVTITALYFNDDGSINPPDAILPISSLSSGENTTSVFSLPDGNASVSLTFPRNVERAIVSVFASGNGNEEFWYTDVPAALTSTFNNTFANGYGPWREVQVLIDGQLAGFVWPFPIVFTGGISPGLWVPIVGIDTYDLGSVDVDVSPWLGILCDGNAHEFELKVVGLQSEAELGTVASNWYVSGEVFLWLDKNGTQTTASVRTNHLYIAGRFFFVPDKAHQLKFLQDMVFVNPEEPSAFIDYQLQTFSNGTNSSLWVSVSAERSLSWSANITTSKGKHNVAWEQKAQYQNIQNFTAAGSNETLWQSTIGTALSQVTTNGTTSSDRAAQQYNYPLSFFQSYMIPTDATTVNSTLYAVLDRSKIETGTKALSHLVYPGSSQNDEDLLLQTRQSGDCFYIWNNTYYEDAGAIDPANGTIGSTSQWFTWEGDVDGSLGRTLRNYSRFASAIDGYEPVLTTDQTSDELIKIPDTHIVTGPGINALLPSVLESNLTEGSS